MRVYGYKFRYVNVCCVVNVVCMCAGMCMNICRCMHACACRFSKVTSKNWVGIAGSGRGKVFFISFFKNPVSTAVWMNKPRKHRHTTTPHDWFNWSISASELEYLRSGLAIHVHSWKTPTHSKDNTSVHKWKCTSRCTNMQIIWNGSWSHMWQSVVARTGDKLFTPPNTSFFYVMCPFSTLEIMAWIIK